LAGMLIVTGVVLSLVTLLVTRRPASGRVVDGAPLT
jgi:hypothetical protein